MYLGEPLTSRNKLGIANFNLLSSRAGSQGFTTHISKAEGFVLDQYKQIQDSVPTAPSQAQYQ